MRKIRSTTMQLILILHVATDFTRVSGAGGLPIETSVTSNAPASRALRPPSAACANAETLIRFEKPETAEIAGIAFATVKSEPLVRTIIRNTEISYNMNRYAHVSSRAAGVVVEVRKDLGAVVTAGDVVCIVDSVEVGAAKAKLLQARERLRLAEQNLEREQTLFKQKISPQRDLLEAETRLAETRIETAHARQTLRNLGLTDDQVDNVTTNDDTSSLLRVKSPFDGLVVERSAVIGEVVSSGQSLLAVADTGRMWAMIDLATSDLHDAKIGQRVTVTIDGMRDESFEGALTWIATHLDPKTRTIKARAELNNGDGLLRAAMFGQARIETRNGDATLVPKESVQWDGCCNLVFVKASADGDIFQPRKVRLGYATNGLYEVLAGVSPGETIVTQGSFLLKTQVLKDNIGAGCCDAVDELPK